MPLLGKKVRFPNPKAIYYGFSPSISARVSAPNPQKACSHNHLWTLAWDSPVTTRGSL